MGLGIIVLIAVMKTLWSVVEGGQAGTSVVIPAAIGLLICVAVIIFVARGKKKQA